MSSNDLVVVLGAGPGLGRSIGTAFANEGNRVVLLARDVARLSLDAEDIGADGHLSVDATDPPALRAAFARIREVYGDPDVLIHNPSVAYEAPPTQTPFDELMAGFALAAGSLLVATQEVAPAMRKAGRGTILVTGSGAALTGSTWSAALAAQKAAVRNLGFSVAAELAPDGIKVATITIDGLLGATGYEHDRIAAVYVRAHRAAQHPDSPWQTEITWRGEAN